MDEGPPHLLNAPTAFQPEIFPPDGKTEVSLETGKPYSLIWVIDRVPRATVAPEEAPVRIPDSEVISKV